MMVTVPWKAQLAPPEAAGIDFVHPIQIGSHHPHLKQNIARSQRRLLQFARTFAKNGRKVTARTQVIHKMWGHFDDFLPMSMHNKAKATRLINDQI